MQHERRSLIISRATSQICINPNLVPFEVNGKSPNGTINVKTLQYSKQVSTCLKCFCGLDSN